MVDCQIIRDGKVEGEVRQNGLTFIDNHGMERSNHIESDAMEVSLKEWHYQKFGIMNQHYFGKANNSKFIAQHEVRPALLFSMPTLGGSMKEVYGSRGAKKEMMWKTGEASLCFLSGEGGANTHLNQGTQFEIFNVVIPQQFIEELIEHDPEAFEQLSPSNQSYLRYPDHHQVQPARHSSSHQGGTRHPAFPPVGQPSLQISGIEDYRLPLGIPPACQSLARQPSPQPQHP